MSSQEIRIIADIQAKPGHEQALRAALQAMIVPTHAEPGCEQYDLQEDLDQPGHFVFFERWTHNEAFLAHTQTPHFKALGPNIEPLLARPVALTRAKHIG